MRFFRFILAVFYFLSVGASAAQAANFCMMAGASAKAAFTQASPQNNLSAHCQEMMDQKNQKSDGQKQNNQKKLCGCCDRLCKSSASAVLPFLATGFVSPTRFVWVQGDYYFTSFVFEHTTPPPRILL